MWAFPAFWTQDSFFTIGVSECWKCLFKTLDFLSFFGAACPLPNDSSKSIWLDVLNRQRFNPTLGHHQLKKCLNSSSLIQLKMQVTIKVQISKRYKTIHKINMLKSSRIFTLKIKTPTQNRNICNKFTQTQIYSFYLPVQWRFEFVYLKCL